MHLCAMSMYSKTLSSSGFPILETRLRPYEDGRSLNITATPICRPTIYSKYFN